MMQVRLQTLAWMTIASWFAWPAQPAARAGTVDAALVGIDYSGQLFSISTTDATYSLLADVDLLNIGGLDFSDGVLYGLTKDVNPVLHSFMPDGAVIATTPVGDLAFIIEGGLALLGDGTAYAINAGFASDPVLAQLDVDSADVLQSTSLTSPRDINGLAWVPVAAGGGSLLGIDRVSNAVVQINPGSGAVTFLRSVPGVVGDVGGMAYLDNLVYFSTAGSGTANPGSSELYSFDPASGTVALVGQLAPAAGEQRSVGSAGFSGLAVVPEPGTLGLLAGAVTLLARYRRRPLRGGGC